MIAKQDRCAARKATDLESKYGFAKRNKATNKAVQSASAAANAAVAAAAAVNQKLTSEQLFNILTENGTIAGLFRYDGQIYVNAAYIKSGAYASTSEVFLEPGAEELDTLKAHILETETIPANKIPLYDFNNDGVVDITDLALAWDASVGNSSLAEWSGAVKSTVSVTIEAANAEKAVVISGTNMWGRYVECYFGISGASYGTHKGDLAVSGRLNIGNYIELFSKNGNPYLCIAQGAPGTPKKISWKDNGDGTYTLIGEDE